MPSEFMPEEVIGMVEEAVSLYESNGGMSLFESITIYVVIFGILAICVFTIIEIGWDLFGTLFKPVIPVVEGMKALAYFLHIRERPRPPGEPWVVDIGGFIFEMD